MIGLDMSAMPPQIVALVLDTEHVKRADLDKIAEAIQIQVDRDLAPAWGLAGHRIVAFDKGDTLPSGAWPIYVRDASSVQGAEGWHSMDAVPDGEVAADLCDGPPLGPSSNSLSTDLSHEVCEMLVDPELDEYAPALEREPNGEEAVVVKEVGDPVSGDSYVVKIKSGEEVRVSNFVLPGWYMPAIPGGRYDQCGLLTAPGTFGTDGYSDKVLADGTSMHLGAKRKASREAAARVAKRMKKRARSR